MAYTTWAAVKTYLDISVTSDDTQGALLVSRACAAIDRYCLRRFEAVTATRTFDVPTGDTLFLDNDLLSITTLTNGDSTVITAASYVLLPKNALPKYAIRLKENTSTVWEGSTTTDYQAISVAGSWGYSTVAPDDIVLATIRWTAWLYRQRDGVYGQSGTAGRVGVIDASQSLPKDIEQLLKPYKRWRIGAS